MVVNRKLLAELGNAMLRNNVNSNVSFIFIEWCLFILSSRLAFVCKESVFLRISKWLRVVLWSRSYLYLKYKENSMKYKLVILSMCLGVAGTLSAQSIYPGQHAGKMKKETVVPLTVESFDLKDIRLLPGRFRENMMRDSAWMLR